MPTLSIVRREIPAQPLLFIQSRVARQEIPPTIARDLGELFQYALSSGGAIAVRPLSRYPSMGPGLLTIEVGIPVAAATAGSGRIQSGELQGGPAAVAMHAGSYETLGDTYAAIERWMQKEGLTPAGPPWESYLTDPAEHPNPDDWRTEVFWPVK
jgi:effector-binding domain-containing protein